MLYLYIILIYYWFRQILLSKMKKANKDCQQSLSEQNKFSQNKISPD